MQAARADADLCLEPDLSAFGVGDFRDPERMIDSAFAQTLDALDGSPVAERLRGDARG